MIRSNNVVEVQRTDLVGNYIGQTGPKTRERIKAAKGGVLFVDEAYRLMPADMQSDFGIEALEEIMSSMDSGETLVIFAGYTKQMQRVISANEGFRKRVAMFFHFDDYTCRDLADIARLKMSIQGRESPLYGFKLHPSCTAESIERVIRQETIEKQRSETNGGLVDTMLLKARENLDKRTDIWCEDIDSLIIITMDDLVAGLRPLRQPSEADGGINTKMAIENISSDQLAETKEKLLKLLEAAEDEVKIAAKRNLEKKNDDSKLGDSMAKSKTAEDEVKIAAKRNLEKKNDDSKLGDSMAKSKTAEDQVKIAAMRNLEKKDDSKLGDSMVKSKTAEDEVKIAAMWNLEKKKDDSKLGESMAKSKTSNSRIEHKKDDSKLGESMAKSKTSNSRMWHGFMARWCKTEYSLF